MRHFSLLVAVMGLLALSQADYVSYSDDVMDEEMIQALQAEVHETRVELGAVEVLTLGSDPRVRASMKDRWNKVKDACKCETHKNCECCVGHEFKIPIVGSYNFKVCTMVGVNPDAKTVNFKVKLGPIKVYEKDVSYVKMDEVCKKFEKYKHLEFCMRMTVTENENNGLRGCVTLQANIMDIFNKPLYFPCLNFKNNKLTMDTNMDDYQDDGVRINLKALWKKFKGLFSKDKKQ